MPLAKAGYERRIRRSSYPTAENLIEVAVLLD
jgi:hypothetical protein